MYAYMKSLLMARLFNRADGGHKSPLALVQSTKPLRRRTRIRIGRSGTTESESRARSPTTDSERNWQLGQHKRQRHPCASLHQSPKPKLASVRQTFSQNKLKQGPPRTPAVHYWKTVYRYQRVSAGQERAGTNVPQQCKAGTLVPARNTSRH
jgi:hypothetical protein